jgi:hypothetical protein
LAAATGAPALLLICGCCGLVEPSRQPSDGSEPSADHSRYELEPQDQVAGGHCCSTWVGAVGCCCRVWRAQPPRSPAQGAQACHPTCQRGVYRAAWHVVQHNRSTTRRGRPSSITPPTVARAISTTMQKDAHLHQHKSRPPRQVLGARAGTVGWPGVQGVAGRPGKRFRPRPVAHSPGPTAPEVAEERRTTPGRSARREELVRANGSIIFGETQDLSFFGHAPRAC